ncbi:MAG: SDR family oxidoreductase [Pleurocapsa sp. MO_226.B13]|nr:SDR family oxidoreductase [Pleurocapsa sp. MO_226.B13]
MSVQKANKVALITGANKGLGFGIARKLGERGITVLIAARNEEKGQEAVDKLQSEGIDAYFIQLDVSDRSTIESAYNAIAERFGKLDILINNAGVNLEFSAGLPAPSQVSLDVLKETFEINFFGVVAVTQAMLPLICQADAGRIVNISSDMASLTLHQDPNFKFYNFKQLAYDSSKTAVNAFTVHLAHELKDTNIKVNSAHPGWVKTDMGTDAGELTIDRGAATPVWLVTLPEDGVTGGYFDENQQPMPW